MLLDEVDVDHSRLSVDFGAVVSLDHAFADTKDGRTVTSKPDLMILRADARAARDHLKGILRVGEALEAAFAQRIEGNDWHTALRRLLERMQHARRVGRRIVAEEEDAIGM